MQDVRTDLPELSTKRFQTLFQLPIVAAGGVSAENAAQYVRAGAGELVTSAPHAARPRDVQVRLRRSRHGDASRS